MVHKGFPRKTMHTQVYTDASPYRVSVTLWLSLLNWFWLHNLALLKRSLCWVTHLEWAWGELTCFLSFPKLLCPSLICGADFPLSSFPLWFRDQLSSASLTTSAQLSTNCSSVIFSSSGSYQMLLFVIIHSLFFGFLSTDTVWWTLLVATDTNLSSCSWIPGRLYFLDAITVKWSHVSMALGLGALMCFA